MSHRTGASAGELAVGLPAAALAGLLVGTLGTFKHQVGVSVATGDGPPVGLLLSLAMVALFLLALRATFPTRWFAVASAGGILAAVGVLCLPGPGGSRVVLLDPVGIAWIFVAPLVAIAVVIWPRRRGRRGADGILAGTAAASEDRTPT